MKSLLNILAHIMGIGIFGLPLDNESYNRGSTNMFIPKIEGFINKVIIWLFRGQNQKTQKYTFYIYYIQSKEHLNKKLQNIHFLITTSRIKYKTLFPNYDLENGKELTNLASYWS